MRTNIAWVEVTCLLTSLLASCVCSAVMSLQASGVSGGVTSQETINRTSESTRPDSGLMHDVIQVYRSSDVADVCDDRSALGRTLPVMDLNVTLIYVHGYHSLEWNNSTSTVTIRWKLSPEAVKLYDKMEGFHVDILGFNAYSTTSRQCFLVPFSRSVTLRHPSSVEFECINCANLSTGNYTVHVRCLMNDEQFMKRSQFTDPPAVLFVKPRDEGK